MHVLRIHAQVKIKLKLKFIIKVIENEQGESESQGWELYKDEFYHKSKR